MSSLALQKDKYNYLIHHLFVRQEFTECLKQIETVLKETNGLCEYAIHVKALIQRQRGQIQDSLDLFQQATALNPHNVSNLKQVGRSLYLLGKHKAAIQIYDEASKIGSPDWEILHNKGLCYMYLKQFDKAIESLQAANVVQPHDSTYLQLGKVFAQLNDYTAAINVHLEAREHSPGNAEILTTLGLLFLRIGDNTRAFDHLGNSLTIDPRNPRTILAAGSIIQDHSDMDVALVKYRVVAAQTPNSPQLWNNIGMCFFGKQRHIASIACLKKALYLGPFEWIISYNLGLVHLHTGQFASAFHFLSASINLKPDFAHSYMYLAVTLSHLEDIENACQAYEKAIHLAGEPGEPVFHLNYAIMLYGMGELPRCKEQLLRFQTLFRELDEEARNADLDVVEQAELLELLLTS
mmetsp:Transcript_33762/g.60952  ORF Transcript_33762/g.60952 Transcript_33762/m.60952 type:complete len:408 (-) Transcript_33762:680-1903(-)